MNSKTLLIIRREYLTRVKKKTFIIMTILGPALFASILLVPMLLANVNSGKETVAVVDDSGIFATRLENSEKLIFTAVEDMDIARTQLQKGTYDLVLHIEKTDSTKANPAALFYEKKQPGLGTHTAIEKQLQDILQNKLLLQTYNISTEDYNKIKAVKIEVKAQDARTGAESSTGIKTGIGYASAFLIYLFVFMFGSQVMQGVLEEKSTRIIEVIVSSVKPFQIMMGKIIGIAMVGLTQFLLWIVLTLGVVAVAGTVLSSKLSGDAATAQTMGMNDMLNPELTEQMQSADMVNKLLAGFGNIDFTLIIAMFIIFFIGGYLLYAALLAAIGSAVDNEADTQQFMLPVTVPLILAIVAIPMVMENPNGNVAFWLSMIPFTSPVVMMMRVPFGVPVWELGLSIGLLVAGFVFTTWLAAKIYRVGILMYGKKVSYKELWKWLRY